MVGEDTPIILDLSDIAKPLARKMDYLATVRDGGTGQLVNGCWLVELYASVFHKNRVPILMEPFSHERLPGARSAKTAKRVAPGSFWHFWHSVTGGCKKTAHAKQTLPMDATGSADVRKNASGEVPNGIALVNM